MSHSGGTLRDAWVEWGAVFGCHRREITEAVEEKDPRRGSSPSDDNSRCAGRMSSSSSLIGSKTLQARGERVWSVAVVLLLGRERSLIEKHPELRRIIRDAQRPVSTPAEVRRACQELRAKGERVSIVAVARMLGVGRHVIERSPTLGAAVSRHC